jgi:aryl-alcohol dehydrogenase-like predicted oxidoreductase
MATKVNPWNGKGLGKESVRKQLETSLANMRVKKVQICYLHAPGEFSLLLPTVAIDML